MIEKWKNLNKYARQGIITLGIYFALYASAWAIFGREAIWYVVIAFLGFVCGDMLGWRRGMKDDREIIEKVYGKEWDRNSTLGRIYRETYPDWDKPKPEGLTWPSQN